MGRGRQSSDEIAVVRGVTGNRSVRRPTMTDVARLAGVSQSSVSLILNRMPGARLTEETRQRVIDAARQTGYELPGERHQQRARTGGNTIAFVIDEISTSPHPVVTLDGVRDAAWEAGFLVASHATRSNSELEAATIDAIRADRSVIGVIYAAIFTREVSPPAALSGLPAVLLNCHAADTSLPAVVPAEVSGGYRATDYVIGKGHRRIGLINGERWMEASADRLKGYRRALAAHRINYDADLVRNGDWLPLRGYELALDLMRIADPPTAIFCANDLMAIGALEAAAEIGCKVPGDLSIMGYDDQELARYTHPPLSTLVLPNYEMGRQAAQLLIDIAVHGGKANSSVVAIEGPLVERASVGAPAL